MGWIFLDQFDIYAHHILLFFYLFLIIIKSREPTVYCWIKLLLRIIFNSTQTNDKEVLFSL